MELIFLQVVWPFIKRNWSYILNVVLLLSLLIAFKVHSSSIESIKQSYVEQEQKAQQEYIKKLTDVVVQRSENEQKTLVEINEINKQAAFQVQQLLEEHQQALIDLNNEQSGAIQKVVVQKQANIKVRVKNSYDDPCKVANETAKRFGFQVDSSCGGK